MKTLTYSFLIMTFSVGIALGKTPECKSGTSYSTGAKCKCNAYIRTCVLGPCSYEDLCKGASGKSTAGKAKAKSKRIKKNN
jgi:hypothetical protein